ncbi:MAG: malate dehydrogenase [Candidatus Bathyarchaeota archaeon]
MGIHIAQIGTGRVGRPTAYTLLCNGLASKLTVCDVKPGLAKAFSEELLHVTASNGFDVEIVDCEDDEDVQEADVILITAGEPRLPGVEMSRRDLVLKNAKVIRNIAEATASHNPRAKYIVITNPVDTMAMVFQTYSKSEFVLSTGTNLESLRFRSRFAKHLKVPVSKVKGWVGGEHGDAATILWSTVKVNNLSVDEYVQSSGIEFNKNEIESYMRKISKFIVDSIGGTEYGPAASFTDIVRAIIQDTQETLAIATPLKFETIPEPVYVSVPLKLGKSIGSNDFENLLEEEKKEIVGAARIIYDNFLMAVKGLAD